ncbi:hypothetical protein J6T21_03520 [Candidatus Saccharibacteria bacterium]|nr:hypothetical protein [Candidatus Saccharibacteria bacterium]
MKFSKLNASLMGKRDFRELVKRIRWETEPDFSRESSFSRCFIILDDEISEAIRGSYSYTDSERLFTSYSADQLVIGGGKVLRLFASVNYQTKRFTFASKSMSRVDISKTSINDDEKYFVLSPRYILGAVAPYIGVYKHLRLLGRYMFSQVNNSLPESEQVKDATGILYFPAGVVLKYRYKDASGEHNDIINIRAMIPFSDGMLLTTNSSSDLRFVIMPLEDIYEDRAVPQSEAEKYFEDDNGFYDEEYYGKTDDSEKESSCWGEKPHWSRYDESYD